MNENKLPDFDSVEELTNFFDDNDLSEYLDAMPEAHFDVAIQRRAFLVPIEKQLMQKLAELAKAQHLSTGELVNAWLEEKVARAA